jgi:hypothetical protein
MPKLWSKKQIDGLVIARAYARKREILNSLCPRNQTEGSKMSGKPNSTEPKKVARKSVVVGIGLVCILLAVSLIGAFAYFVPMVNDKDNTISSLKAQISSQQSQISQLNFSDTLHLGELKSLLDRDLPEWILNMTVTLEGNLTTAAFSVPPTQSNLQLISGNQSIGVQWQGSVPNDSAGVKVTGFLRQEALVDMLSVWFYYYIEAETVEPL